MRAIDAITADYAARKDQHIDVPEWQVDGKPLRIFWELLTIEERKKLTAGNKTDVDILVAMARDENGDKLFSLEDKPKLKLHADAVIITRVAAAMLGLARVTGESIEDAEKN